MRDHPDSTLSLPGRWVFAGVTYAELPHPKTQPNIAPKHTKARNTLRCLARIAAAELVYSGRF